MINATGLVCVYNEPVPLSLLILTIFSGPILTWERGEILTIVSREKDDKFLLRDSRGTEQLVSSTFIREMPSSSVRQF